MSLTQGLIVVQSMIRWRHEGLEDEVGSFERLCDLLVKGKWIIWAWIFFVEWWKEEWRMIEWYGWSMKDSVLKIYSTISAFCRRWRRVEVVTRLVHDWWTIDICRKIKEEWRYEKMKRYFTGIQWEWWSFRRRWRKDFWRSMSSVVMLMIDGRWRWRREECLRVQPTLVLAPELSWGVVLVDESLPVPCLVLAQVSDHFVCGCLLLLRARSAACLQCVRECFCNMTW